MLELCQSVKQNMATPKIEKENGIGFPDRISNLFAKIKEKFEPFVNVLNAMKMKKATSIEMFEKKDSLRGLILKLSSS